MHCMKAVMHRLHPISMAVSFVLMILSSACGGAPAAAPTIAAPATAAPVTVQASPEEPISTEEAIANQGAESLWEEFVPSNFSNPTAIDNPWFPMIPGTQYVFDGVTEEGGARIPHRVIITITDLTKVIDGVRTVVTWDQDLSEGNLVETELAFFAQDNDGNIWRLGEYPEAYDEFGKFVEAPAWISGLKGARAGIIMTADPQMGDRSYSQGWGPAVGFTDRGQVDQMGLETCVPLGCYENVLVIAESSQAEPDAVQLKYYARGVGNVRVGWSGEDATREDLELVEIIQLTPEALDEARAQALELEKRAYANSKEVYGMTPPSE